MSPVKASYVPVNTYETDIELRAQEPISVSNVAQHKDETNELDDVDRSREEDSPPATPPCGPRLIKSSPLPVQLTSLLGVNLNSYESSEYPRPIKLHATAASTTTRARIQSLIWLTLKYLLLAIGAYHILIYITYQITALPSHSSYRWSRHGRGHHPKSSISSLPPIPCHSHNDYLRPQPLFDALHYGCVSVEADIWLLDASSSTSPLRANASNIDDRELYVGHTRRSLTGDRTLRSLYLDPIEKLLDGQNLNRTANIGTDVSTKLGIFPGDETQPLVLLIDFKTDGERTWDVLMAQLDALRTKSYLTYFDGSEVRQGVVTVVLTGNAPFHKVLEGRVQDGKMIRDVFFDAPLQRMDEIAEDGRNGGAGKSEGGYGYGYDSTLEQKYLSEVEINISGGLKIEEPQDARIYTRFNSFYASTSFYNSIGRSFPLLGPAQRNEVGRQISGAHRQELMVRYWETPGWPIGLRDYIWSELVKQGVDFLNVDDLRAATRGRWVGKWFGKGGWSEGP